MSSPSDLPVQHSTSSNIPTDLTLSTVQRQNTRIACDSCRRKRKRCIMNAPTDSACALCTARRTSCIFSTEKRSTIEKAQTGRWQADPGSHNVGASRGFLTAGLLTNSHRVTTRQYRHQTAHIHPDCYFLQPKMRRGRPALKSGQPLTWPKKTLQLQNCHEKALHLGTCLA